ncbi:methyltransferase-like protein 27 [Oratosquilla oratoria]|uniref:methyltransferase-like protein 27 n=1 Tax=Oratosquilla oratoria TaxID=337810 RepID=UPI003F75BF8E
MVPKHYKGPKVAANAIASLYKEKGRPQVKILDVAAGTGLVGINLQELGFTLIDALDPCEDMLKVLKESGAYKNIYREYISDGRSSVPSDAYDVVVVCGGMGQGHIPVHGLDEMLRMTKSGGYVCNAMRREFKDIVDHYKDKLIPHIESMEQNKKWKKISCEIVEGFFCDKDGLLFVHQKL